MKFAALVASFCLLGVTAAPSFSAVRDNRCSNEFKSPYTAAYQATYLSPGIPWNVWAYFLDIHWGPAEIASAQWFMPDTLAKAARKVSLEIPTPEYHAYFENYRPLVAASDGDVAAYDQAAALYRQKRWDDSIVLFDNIAATISPYRAAAAYSAARAAFYLGHFDDGFHRIDRLLSDPAMHEFNLAAYRLVGTLANQTGAAPLVAGRFTEISHYLTAPLELLCREEQLRKLAQEAQEDLFYILRFVFPEDHSSYYWSQHTRQILDALATDDPFLDLVRVLAAPTPYHRSFGTDRGPDYGWIETLPPLPSDFRSYSFDLAAHDQANADAETLTDHARQQWLATRNLLWGYALSVRTSASNDLPLIRNMLDAVNSLPRTPELASTILALHGQLVAQEARLLLMAGRMGDALTVLRDGTIREAEFSRGAGTQFTPGLGFFRESPGTFVLDGGVRYFLERRDLDAARKWASELQGVFPRGSASVRLNVNLALLLVQDWDEFVEIGSSQRAAWRAAVAPAALDLLPAHKLIALSRHRGLPADYKRALLSAGWVRLYLLGRWQEFLDLVPNVREAFPEFASDLDQIGAAWTDRTRHRLVTRLLLRAPGLSPRVLWARSLSERIGGAHDVFSINGEAPSDGNWWCALDVRRATEDILGQYFVGPIEPNKGRAFDPASVEGLSRGLSADAGGTRLAAEAEKLIAWHPLFQLIDFDELTQLSKVESGPKQLSEEAIAWADGSHWFTRLLGFDDLLPETLHLAVRSTRYGCRLAGGHGAYSHAAYEALHKLYPGSEWAKKTPYWFDRFYRPGWQPPTAAGGVP